MKYKFCTALLAALLLWGCGKEEPTYETNQTVPPHEREAVSEVESGHAAEAALSSKNIVPSPNLGGLSVCPSTNEVCYPCSPDGDYVQMNGGLLFVNGLLTDVHCVTTIDGELYVSLDAICGILGYDMNRAEFDALRNGEEDIFVTPDRLTTLLPEVEVCVYDGAVKQGFDTSDMVRMVLGVPNVMVSAYPEEAISCTAEAAVERLKEGLILAYENTYGAFEPLHTEPETWLSDEVNLRYEITTLDVCAENDRFYIIPLYGYYYVDKYTDTIYRYYNGYDQTITVFDPAHPYALVFAG